MYPPHPSMYPLYYAPSMVSYGMFSAPNAAANTAASIPRKKFMYTQANPTAYTHTMDNTNIYIRGLAPDTTDADLEALCSIYGRILSSKAIVDLKTGICKGFGFAMFETMDMASMALDGLSRQGFLVTFAVQGPRGDSVRVSIFCLVSLMHLLLCIRQPVPTDLVETNTDGCRAHSRARHRWEFSHAALPCIAHFIL